MGASDKITGLSQFKRFGTLCHKSSSPTLQRTIIRGSFTEPEHQTAAPDLQGSVALGGNHMKKLIDSMQRVQFTNAVAVLEEYGLGHVHCKAGLMKSQDVWTINLPGHIIHIYSTGVKGQWEIDIKVLGTDLVKEDAELKEEKL